MSDTDTIEVGDKVSWKSLDEVKRHTGYIKVLPNPHGFYQIRTRYGMIVPIHQSRITKECG